MPLDQTARTPFTKVGTRPLRPDGVDKVTGRARFGADMNAPGMLIGKILRSPHAHARIRSIDASAAEALPGVKAVVTRDDFADRNDEFRDVLVNVMARDKALYDGHAVAAIAATSAVVARKALALIKVDYEVLPHVTDVEKAMRPDAPLIQESLITAGLDPAATKPSNVAARHQFGHGDVEAGFAAADVVIERSFRTEATHQGYIEPHACLASVELRRAWRIVGLHAGPLHGARHLRGAAWHGHLQAARHRFRDRRRIRRQDNRVHRAGGAGAVAQGRRPVKLVMTPRRGVPRHRSDRQHQIRVKMGVSKDGTHHRRRGGAGVPGRRVHGRSPVELGAHDVLRMLRRSSNVQVDGYDVVANRPKHAAYRAPGAPMAAFAVEGVVNELAAAAGHGPDRAAPEERGEGRHALRLRPDLRPDRLASRRWRPRKNHPHYYRRRSAPTRAAASPAASGSTSAARPRVSLSVNVDGTVALALGTPDIGGSRASMA